MKKPGESYFKHVSLFPDLPFLALTTKSISEQLLKDMGVRSHVELQMVFDRLDDLNWDHVQLVKYLASVQDQLTDSEWDRLKKTPLLPRELADRTTRKQDSSKSLNEEQKTITVKSKQIDLDSAATEEKPESLKQKIVRRLSSASEKPPVLEAIPDDEPFIRFKASALYVPLDVLRQMNLHILDWPRGKWKSASPEGKNHTSQVVLLTYCR
jgi:hypothetical protein